MENFVKKMVSFIESQSKRFVLGRAGNSTNGPIPDRHDATKPQSHLERRADSKPESSGSSTGGAAGRAWFRERVVRSV